MKYRKNVCLMLTIALAFSFSLLSSKSNLTSVKAATTSNAATTLLDLNFNNITEGTTASALGFKVITPTDGSSAGAYVKANPDGSGKSLYMFDNSVDKSAQYDSTLIHYSFTPQTSGVVTSEVKFMQDTTDRERMGIMNLVDSDGRYIVRMITDPSTESICLLPQSAPDAFLQYEPGVWYTVKVVEDVRIAQIAIYVNDKLVWSRRPTVDIACKDFAGLEIYTPGASSSTYAGQYINYIKVQSEDQGSTPVKVQNVIAYPQNNKTTLFWDQVLQASSSNVGNRGVDAVTNKPFDYQPGYEFWISTDPNAEFDSDYVIPNNGDNRTDNTTLGQTYSYGAPVLGKNIWTLSNTYIKNDNLTQTVTLTKLYMLDTKISIGGVSMSGKLNLQNGTTYYIKVRAVDKTGVAGPFSDIVTVVPGTPATIPSQGNSIISNLNALDIANATNYDINNNLQIDDLAYGSTSTEELTAIPSKYLGMTWISPSYASRTFGSSHTNGDGDNLMNFVTSDDCQVFIGMDTKAVMSDMPGQWIIKDGWTKVDGDVIQGDGGAETYQLYEKDFAKGDTVTLKSMLNDKATAVASPYITLVNMKQFNLNVEKTAEVLGNNVLTIAGGISRPAYVDISVNGQLVQTGVYVSNPLTFAKDITLIKGVNNIEVDAYNVEGLAETYTTNVTYDSDYPTITIDPVSKQVNDLNLNLTGTSSKDVKATIKVNSVTQVTDLQIKAGIQFSIPAILAGGSNTIDIDFVDIAGHETKNSYVTNLLFSVDQVSFNDGKGNPVSAIKAGQSVNAEAKITNKTDSDQNSMLVIVFYDSNNVMINYNCSEYLVKHGETTYLNSSIIIPANAVKIKTFVWGDINNVIPVSQSYTLK